MLSHKGEHIRFVDGRDLMDATRKDYQQKLPERMEKMVNNLLESENL